MTFHDISWWHQFSLWMRAVWCCYCSNAGSWVECWTIVALCLEDNIGWMNIIYNYNYNILYVILSAYQTWLADDKSRFQMARTCPTFDQFWEHLVRVPSHLPHIHVAMAEQKHVVTCPQIQINSTSFCIRLLLHKHPPKSWEPKWTKGCQVGLSRSDSFRSSKIIKDPNLSCSLQDLWLLLRSFWRLWWQRAPLKRRGRVKSKVG